MLQVLFRIPTPWGGVPIYGFGVMLFAAFILCTWEAGKRAEREGVDKNNIGDFAVWLFLGGLLGARVTYLLQTHPIHGFADFIDFLVLLPRIWDGGIILYGAVLGAVIAAVIAHWFIFRKRGLAFVQFCDIVAPSVAIGVGLGRIGCLLNGCCYGLPLCATCVAEPIHFPLSAPPRADLVRAGVQTAAGFTFAAEQPAQGARVGRVEPGSSAANAGLSDGDLIVSADGTPVRNAEDLAMVLEPGLWPRGKNDLTLAFQTGQGDPPPDPTVVTCRPASIGLHPTQIYETISMALLYLVLAAFYPLRTRRGQVMAVLMIGYGLHRYLNELLRGDPRPEGFEWVGSVILVVGGVVLWLALLARPAEFRLEWGRAAGKPAG